MRNNFSLAQCLYNEGGSVKDNVQDLLAAAEQDESLLAKHFTNDELDNRPIRTAVQLAAGDAYEAELENLKLEKELEEIAAEVEESQEAA